MADFTVEVYGEPVTDWAKYYAALDAVPGTILIEDSDEPCLVFQIEAETLSEAAILVQGVIATLGVNVVWGRAYLTEPNSNSTPSGHTVIVPDFVPSWLEDAALTELALSRA